MNNETQNQIASLEKQIKELQRISIQLNIDPTTSLYLNKEISDVVTVILPALITAAVSTLPTQTYSAGSPSGSAPAGSIWFKDTGVLATREIHMYSGSAWVQFK